MTEPESMDHPSGLPETKVSGEDPMKALDLYLKLAKECVKAVRRKMPSCEFNKEQCDYLVGKLVVVVQSASAFLEVLPGECHRPCLPEDIARHIEIFKLLFTLAKQIESFVQGCSRDDWIQSAMTLTNASEYVSSIGFNLELLQIVFGKESAATGSLTSNQVGAINKAEVMIVREKLSLDADTLVIKVIQKLTSLRDEEKELAGYLLQRLKQVKPIPVTAFPASFLAANANRGFLGSMFRWVNKTTKLGGCASGATVYKAMWLGTPVAMKTFYGPEDPNFMKEVDILEKLCHPNVTSMFCSAMDSRRCSIVMELMDGDLYALMQRRLDENPNSPPFAILEAIDLMHQVAEGVNYLHNERIEHRDLKSFNILVKSLNLGDSAIGYVHAKVADFGISTIKESSIRYSNRTLNTGTTRWMAPEIIKLNNVGSQGNTSRSKKVPKYSFKCDVYSFAMVCFEILTGSVPFSAIPYPNMVNRKVLTGDRPKLPDHCPSNLKVLIEKCWSQEPFERPSFEDICLELKYLKSLLMMGSSQGPHISIENPQQVATVNKPLQGSRVTEVKQLQLQTVVTSSKGSSGLRMMEDDTVQDGVLVLNVDGRDHDVLEPKHKIYLCQSASETDFVEQLCVDLERYDRYPFFDKRLYSSPTIEPFPNLLFSAIGQCQVGIFVISWEFFTSSKWPMMELVAFIKLLESGGRSNLRQVLPVFLGIPFAECCDPLNHNQWILVWQGWAESDNTIDIDEWVRALKWLRGVNGLVLRAGGSEVKLREEIVEQVCNLIPAETRWDDSFLQGRLRICEALRQKFVEVGESSRYGGVRVVGLYGMGGIGKTSFCKALCNYLSIEFHEKVCHVELGSESELHLLQRALTKFANLHRDILRELDINFCYDLLKRRMPQQRVFLAIDDVYIETIQEAETLLCAGYAPGSIVVVATRSLGVLQALKIPEGDCLEMPELEYDEARSLFLVHARLRLTEVDEQILNRYVQRCYFSKGYRNGSYHYHPLALKVLAVQCDGELAPELHDFNRLKEVEHPLFSILRISFDMLRRDDQLLFMDVAVYYPERFVLSKRWNIIEWLSMVNGRRINAITRQLEGLKRNSLVADLGDGSTVIGMHDLWREFFVAEKRVEDLKSLWVYEVYSPHFSPEDSSLRGGGWERLERICLKGDGTVSNPMRYLNLNDCTNVTVLKLVNCHLAVEVLDFRPLKRLRSLEILSCTFSTSEISHVEVHGLGMLKKLAVLKWDNISRVSPWLEEIGLLTSLEILELESSEYENMLPDLGRLHFLREATLRFRDGASIISGLSLSMTSLQYLDLGGCHRLRSCPGVGSLVELEELDLRNCLELKELPNLQQLTSLRKLDISGCPLIRALPGLDDVVSLEELRTEGCSGLELPDLTRLPNLRVFPITTGA